MADWLAWLVSEVEASSSINCSFIHKNVIVFYHNNPGTPANQFAVDT